jgi:RNA polymerase sigma factor (sigma-70 family)
MSPWLSDLLLRSQTDERLIALAHLGHKRAFELIVERYRRPLTAFARRIDPHRAEDLVQQTFLSALLALQAGTEVRHLRGWLYEILRNQARREYGPSATLAELDEADSATESAQQVAERRMLAVDALGAVAGLPARQHDAIVQMAFQGLSRTEVANSMGLSEGAVRQLVHRARATVRTAVTAITPMPILRWLYSPRSGSGSRLAEAIGAGTASGAGIALKVGVGAVVASGIVAGGVISAVSPHHRAPTRIASRSPSAGIQAAAGGSEDATGGAATSRDGIGAALASGAFEHHRHGRLRGRAGLNGAGVARIGQDRPASGRDGGSGSGSGGPGPGDGGSSSGGTRGDGTSGSDHGSSGPGSGDHGSSGSDGGGTGSGDGSGTDGGGSSGRDGGGLSGGGGGTDGGGGSSQPVAVTSGHDGGGSGGGDGGLVSSGGSTGTTSSGDGGGLSGSGDLGGSSTSGATDGSGSSSGSSSDGGSTSDSGSGSDGGSMSGSGSGSTSTSGSGSLATDGR